MFTYRIWHAGGGCLLSDAKGYSPRQAFAEGARKEPTLFDSPGRYLVAKITPGSAHNDGHFTVIERKRVERYVDSVVEL